MAACASPYPASLTLLARYADILLRETAALAADHVRDLMALAMGPMPDAAESARRGGLRAAWLAAVKSDIADPMILRYMRIGAGEGVPE